MTSLLKEVPGSIGIKLQEKHLPILRLLEMTMSIKVPSLKLTQTYKQSTNKQIEEINNKQQQTSEGKQSKQKQPTQ